MTDGVRVICTDDGSASVFAERFGASYHSTHGALQETQHVFVEAGLAHRSRGTRALSILDVGYGTGLNFICSAAFAKTHGVHVDYVGVETYPLAAPLLAELRYADLVPPNGTPEQWRELVHRTHAAPWGSRVVIDDNVRLHKVDTALTRLATPPTFDLVYFDAFSPEIQPELWTPDTFAIVGAAMRSGGSLVTYCAKGQVRRDLQSLGFTVERLPGPPGKREMLRATKG